MTDLKPWIGRPPDTEAPEIPGYHQLRMERLSIGPLTVVSVVLIPVWTFVFLATLSLLGGRDSFSFEMDLSGLLISIAGFFLITVLVVLVHEAVHGLAGRLQGAEPAYGVGPGFAYTTFFKPMNRRQFLIVGISPLIVISALCIALALAIPSIAGWFIVAAILNATGAIGDLWMTWRIVKAPAGAIFYDLADGFMVYEPTVA